MKNDLFVKEGVSIPFNEIEVSTSRAGGPGGQHVNKTDTRITLRWNVYQTVALDDFQKQRVITNFSSRLTTEGDFIVHNSVTRSQTQNKEQALATLAQEVKKALYVPKKRMKTKVSKGVKEKRLDSKARRSDTKKLRSSKNYD